MHAGSTIPRSLLLALWLGIAAVVLQGFGATLHACTHRYHDLAPVTTPVPQTQGNHAHICSHTHHSHHDAPHPEPGDTAPPQDDHDRDDTPERHNDCPTCLKLASNARQILASPLCIPGTLPLVAPCIKLAATEARSHIADPNLPARGPPTRIA
ncbi:MAG: hypothetical protein KIT19_10640 [Phycisphaeraceae bacterium]|nr:hypothetical protein [Phycisphaeraceae bacterium]